MISGLNPSNEQFLASLNDLQTRMSDTQTQLSTGLRVNQASDAPQEVADIFQARADLSSVKQIAQNLNTVKLQADAADTSLQSAVQLLQNALTLGSQGAGTTATSDQRQTLAAQVQSLQEQLVGISSTNLNGIYIFSGDSFASPSYKLNLASPTGVDRLVKTQATQLVKDPAGVTFPIAKTAQDLFDKRDASDNPAPENAFAALNNLRLGLLNNDPNAITQAMDSLRTAGTYLNQQLGFYGTVQDRIASSLDLAQKFQVQDQTQLSNLQDADVAALAVQLTQETTNLNAAMAAQARKRTTTLFDYLPLA
jgi:flagellar hook-associated protein 3 FlgL